MPIEKLEGLKGLKGLSSLSAEEQSAWINKQVSAGKLPKGWNYSQANRLYKNKLFIDEFDVDTFRAMSDPEQRDAYYRDFIVNRETDNYFGNDKAYGAISNLTTAGKEELLNSGYLNDADSEKDLEDTAEVYRKSLKRAQRWMPENAGPAAQYAPVEDEVNTFVNSQKSARASTLERVIAKDNKKKISDSKEDIDSLYNYYVNAQSAWTEANNHYQNLFNSNKEVTDKDLDDIVSFMSSHYLMTPEQGEKLKRIPPAEKANYIGQILSISEFNPQRIDTLFDSVASPRTIEYKSEFGDETQSYTLPGSRTYNALRDTDRFSNFGAGDKLREYLTWQVLSQKYGTQDAISALETSMAEYAKENEGVSEWLTDVSFNIALGGIANIMNKVNALNNIGIEAKHGNKGLANVLAGKNADGSDREQYVYERGEDPSWLSAAGAAGRWMWDNALNPYYWSKVDQYNTLDPFLIAEADEDGGISPFVTTKLPDEPLKFFSSETAKEALKMSKFVWSDYLIGRLLGGINNGAVGLSSRISPALGKAVGKIGAYGIAAASGMGIAESYGTMTFEQTYQEALQALDEQEQAGAARYVQSLKELPENQERINQLVKEKMALQDRLTRGQENPVKLSEEEIRKQIENDFDSYYTNQYLNSDDVKASRQQAEEQAQIAAANAYIADATIEEIRMAFANVAFRKYLFDSGTLNRLGVNSTAPVTAAEDGTLSLADKALARAKATLAPFYGGFESNYFDDVTVGFGKGFGLGQYNDWLKYKYDPDKTADASDLSLSFIAGLGAGLEGAESALYDKQSFYDGFVGALGSFTSVMPRFTRSERAEALKNMGKEKGDHLNALETLNYMVMNPLLDAYYRARGNEATTENSLKAVNGVIRNSAPTIEDINSLIIGMNSVSESNTSKSVRERKDAKEKQAFGLLQTLTGLSSSPVIGESPKIQNAMAEIDRLASGNITEQDIKDFYSQPENRALANSKNAEKIARDRIKKNAKSLQQMAKKMMEVSETLNNNPISSVLTPAVKEQLVFQLTMDEAWRTRLSDIEKTISGRNKSSKGHSAVAAYGNKVEFNRQLEATQNEIARINEEQNKANEREEKQRKILRDDNATDIQKESARAIIPQVRILLNRYEEQLNELRAKLKQMERDASIFESDDISVLTRDEILTLNPEERGIILDSKNRDNYSDAQKVEIDAALADIRTREPDALSLVADSKDLSTRIRDNKSAYNRIITHPEIATVYAGLVQDSRKRQLLEVFAKRRIAEVYKKFDSATSDDELRAFAKMSLNSKKPGLRSSHIDAYIKEHPEKKHILQGFYEVAKVREDLHNAIEAVTADAATKRKMVEQAVESTLDAENGAQAISAVESLIDIQTSPEAKMQYDLMLNKMESFGHQRDATKARDRAEERRKKAEAEAKALSEEAKKDGKNFGWPGYKVGDTAYITTSGRPVTIVGFEKATDNTYKIILEAELEGGKVGRFRYSQEDKERLSKEKPKKDAPVPPPAETKTKRKGDTQLKHIFSKLEQAKTPEEKAQAISDYWTNKYHGAEVTAEEEAKIQQAIDELAKEGYEVINMIGKPYNDGMKVIATFKTDESLAPGETIIDGIRKPQINKDGVMVQAAEIVVRQSPFEIEETEEASLSALDEEGKAVSTSAEKQQPDSKYVIPVPNEDPTSQGNVLPNATDVLPGNKFVEISISKLEQDGIVEPITPNDPNSVIGKLREWLDNNKIKLQEIIDKEFGKIITKNPKTKIQFMMQKLEDSNNKLQTILFNVIEFTPEVAKIHDDSRGGVIQANGKSWLVVGTAGYLENDAAQRNAYNTMKAPISRRRMEYFEQHSDEKYYVDPIAYSYVQNTTSGRIVNQREGGTPKLKKVSELLKSYGLTLKQAAFGIQTKEEGNKNFAITKNVKDSAKVFPPRAKEDNRGRTFILLDTPNGNKIPGMIEPAMLNNLEDGSPLKDLIFETIGKLFNTKYEVRKEAIKKLCGYLVLNDSKNILIGKDGVDVITIRRDGIGDISQKLGEGFDVNKFFKDLENANFQINVTLETLEDPYMLKVYDDSGALMTTVDDVSTAGMSYSIYATDASGKPIMVSPVGNAVPGTGVSELKPARVTRVNNNTYEFRDGVFIDKATKRPVPQGSALELSCKYNLNIKERQRSPILTREGKEYFSIPYKDGSGFYIVERDGLGNITFLSQEEADKIQRAAQDAVDRKTRQQNIETALEEVNLFDEPAAPAEPTSAEEMSIDDINRQLLGDFAPPTETHTPTPKANSVNEVKETQTQDVAQLQKLADKYLEEAYPMPNKELYEGKTYGTSSAYEYEVEQATRRKERIRGGTYYKLHDSDLAKSTEALIAEIEQMRNQLVEDNKVLAERRKQSAGEKGGEAVRGPLASIALHSKRLGIALEALYAKIAEMQGTAIKEGSLEIKEKPTQEAKEVITDVGNKSLAELQNKENLSTFAEIIVSNEYGDALYGVLEKKGWGVNEDMPIKDMENLLEQHNVPITNITNIQSWMDLIKDCR